MKFSERWLRNWVDIHGISISKLVEQLTNIGLEVEGIESGHILDVAVPPNRGDCLSIVGIARELAVFNQGRINEVSIEDLPNDVSDSLTVVVQDTVACPKYLGRVIKNIDNSNTVTPKYICNVLIEAGIKLISPVVDITNYVMLEFGQPLHAFDLNCIDKEIIIRKAIAGEKLTLLDDKEILLQEKDLVIADQSKPLALAGIMGGKGSGVQEHTKDLFLECAYFEPIAIRLSARDHNVHTDSSYRFERGIDPNLAEKAMARVTSLLHDVVGGKIGPIVCQVDVNTIPKQKTIYLRKARISKILGITIEDKTIEEILNGLCVQYNADQLGWQVVIPSYRVDLVAEIDLIEEIARFFGYQNIPSSLPKMSLHVQTTKEAEMSEMQIKSCFRHRGYNEVITYSFIDHQFAEMFAPKQEYLELVNPISADLSIMRPNLIPGLIKVLQYNQHRQCDRLRIFEIGLKFFYNQKNELQQSKVLAGLCAGNVYKEQWGFANKPFDFFDIKSDIEALNRLNNNELSYTNADSFILHPGQSAIILKDQSPVGIVGLLHPRIIKELDLNPHVFVFEIDFTALSNDNISEFCCISKFPSIRRDLAIVVNKESTIDNIALIVKKEVGDLLYDFLIFDIYSGKGIDLGKKSVALGLILNHPSRTLVDEEIHVIMEKLMCSLKANIGAEIRK